MHLKANSILNNIYTTFPVHMSEFSLTILSTNNFGHLSILCPLLACAKHGFMFITNAVIGLTRSVTTVSIPDINCLAAT